MLILSLYYSALVLIMEGESPLRHILPIVSIVFGHANRNDSAVGDRDNNGEKIVNCLKIRIEFFVLQDLLILYRDRELVELLSKSGVGEFA